MPGLTPPSQRAETSWISSRAFRLGPAPKGPRAAPALLRETALNTGHHLGHKGWPPAQATSRASGSPVFGIFMELTTL